MGVEEKVTKPKSKSKPKMALVAFQALISHFCAAVEGQEMDEPKTVEVWMTLLLTWLDYPPATIKASQEPDITTSLGEYFPELFKPDFDPEKYFDSLYEQTAEQTGLEASDVKRKMLKLVE